MFYLFFAALAISVPVIFYLSTREYRSWSLIKDRWFRAGIDNGLIFSSEQKEAGGGDEIARLDGEYNSCAVTLCTIRRDRPLSFIKVSYPHRLKERLRIYPEAMLNRMAELLSKQSAQIGDEEFDAHFAVQESQGRILHKRLNPRIVEQLLELRQQSRQHGDRFELTDAEIKFEQERLLLDPLPLFPILDEMVITVNLLIENIEHLLVQ